MVVGEIAESVDLLVVGAGSGGYTAALRAAQQGRDVTLVDRNLPHGLGGVCLHDGCIPSKMLIDAAGKVAGAQTWAGTGVVGDLRFDPGGFQQHRRDVVTRLSNGVANLLRRQQVDMRQGTLRFTRPGAAVLHTDTDQAVFLEYRDVIIATGSRPVELPGLPYDGTRVVSSTDLLRLEKLPESIAVVGGGYIGVELATALAKLGVTVTIVEQSPQLLPTMEANLVAPVQRRLRQLGVAVHLSSRLDGVDEDHVQIRGEAGSHRASAQMVLVSVGRRPNTDDLGLAALGVTPLASGHLAVAPDRRLTPHVAAIGDCTPGPALAHKASAEAPVAVDALGGLAAAFDAVVPEVVFSDPPIAITGATAAQAREAGHDVTVARFPLSALGRAVAGGHTDGFARLVTEAGSGVLLGAQLVGAMAPELIGEVTLAIELGATAEDLALTVHPHPTYAEQLVEAAHNAIGAPLHSTEAPARRQ